MNSPTQNHLWKLLLILLLCSFSAYSQKFDLTEKIPVDPNVKIGTLENGLTYYIRKNAKPENRAELRLFVNIGAVNEDDDQLGLAHFVEHMCFNGTKHFEENELIHYLQSIGMKMGPDINGFTSFDETVYMITVPTDDKEVFDKGLLIMEDWAHNVTFDHGEIDKERGIVIEEWRLGRGAGQRMSDQYLPVLFKDSHYAKRLPIGKKEIIESASYETVKRFYNDWYRPELMAFAVVGDVDLAETEKKIKEHFGRIEKKDKPREKKIYDIPDHKESLVSVVSDKENPYTQVVMIYKHNLEKQKNLGDLRKQLLVEMFTGMLNQRFNELREKADPPFIQGGTYYGQLWARNKSAYQSYVLVKEDGIEKGLQTLIEENERVKRFGFTESELERYKKTMLRNYQSRYNERDKTESANYTWEYMDHFLKDKPIPGIEFLYEFAQKTLPGIRVEEVNELAGKLVRDDNNVILVMGVEKEGVVLPKQEELLASINNIDLSKLQAYEDKTTSDKLMTELPKAGKVVNETKIEAIEVKRFTLSNGAKVIIKPTDFKNDEVLFEATSEGGQSLYLEKDMFSARFAANIVNESGTGPFKKTELSKFLAGKRVWVNPYISDYYEGMNGGCSPEDLETMFQIIHLQFTQPKLDAEAVQSFISRGKEAAKNTLSAPTSDFFYQVSLANADNHPRTNKMPLVEDYDKIDPPRSLEIYRERFADASDFTFYFIGSFKEEDIKPLLETYIASLPSQNKKEKLKDLGIRAPKSYKEHYVHRGTDPKSFISLYFEGPAVFDQDDAHLMWTLTEYLKLKYFDVLREEMSGVYGFNVYGGLGNVPWQHGNLGIVIPCAPENVDKLVEAALKEVEDVKANGISDSYIQKLKTTQQKSFEREIKENRHWLYQLIEIQRRGENYDRLANRQRQIDLITSEAIQAVAQKYIDPENYVKVVLYPEGMAITDK